MNSLLGGRRIGRIEGDGRLVPLVYDSLQTEKIEASKGIGHQCPFSSSFYSSLLVEQGNDTAIHRVVLLGLGSLITVLAYLLDTY